jgi:hypothetical protein
MVTLVADSDDILIEVSRARNERDHLEVHAAKRIRRADSFSPVIAAELWAGACPSE